MAEIAAVIYCRISLSRDGDTTKVEDQARICRDIATAKGWEIAAGCGYPEQNGVYTDNSKSAWQKNRKRAAWDQMLRDVEAGKFGAIIVYHGDRMVRRPQDLGKLLDLSENKGIRLASPGGEYDLDKDKMILWIQAAFAENESDRTSQRRKSQYERWRREGKVRPGGRGGRAYGFTTKDAVVPAEADLIRAAAQRILSGEGTSQVARWLNETGAVTPAGRPFTHGTVRKMLSRARYAGLMPDGSSTASWEPVLERATWESVAAVLNDRAAGFGYVTNARKYLLSGIATCGVCGSGLQLRAESRQRPGAKDGYGCVRSGCRKVQRNITLLDGYVTAMLIEWLTRAPDARIPDTPGLAAEFASLTQARAEIEAALADHTRGKLTALLARLDSVDKRLAELREMAGDNARGRLLITHAGITGEEFAALPLSVRRSLVSAAFEITVLPASKRGPGFNTDDVRVTPR